MQTIVKEIKKEDSRSFVRRFSETNRCFDHHPLDDDAPMYSIAISATLEGPTFYFKCIFGRSHALLAPYLHAYSRISRALSLIRIPADDGTTTGQDSLLPLKLYIITWPVSSFQQSMLANYCWGKLKRHIPDVSLES